MRHAGDQQDAQACREVNHVSPPLSSLTSARSNSGASGPVRLRLPPGSVSLQLMTDGRSDDTATLCLGGRKRFHRDRDNSGHAGRIQQSLTMQITPVKYQIITNTMFTRLLCYAGTRLQA